MRDVSSLPICIGRTFYHQLECNNNREHLRWRSPFLYKCAVPPPCMLHAIMWTTATHLRLRQRPGQ
uniref:Uncharacterized protein n=1 Tax=Arundo donax TaxID=35708 RepID=A0A0A9GHZ4_ARUDO